MPTRFEQLQGLMSAAGYSEIHFIPLGGPGTRPAVVGALGNGAEVKSADLRPIRLMRFQFGELWI